MTEIPAALIAAYEATEYRVRAPRAFTLRVGQWSAELSEVYAAQKVASAGFLTACNPFSRAASEEDNRRAQQDLVHRLAGLGLVTMPAIGVDPSGDWPGEESVFVPGLTLDQACALGNEFGQNAVLWADADVVPRLVLLR